MAAASRGLGRTAAAAALPARPDLRSRTAALAPSARSVASGLALALVGAAAYAGARQTGSFAIRDVAVRGAPPAVAREIRAALAPVRSTSLLRLDGDRVATLAGQVPRVAAIRYDRAFPNTLVVSVTLERPVGVIRRGAEAWLVSARGRVLERLGRTGRPPLARIWVTRAVSVSRGRFLSDASARRAVEALATVRDASLPVRLLTVRAEPGQLTFVLASGVELRLGDGSSLPLKLAVAGRVLRSLQPPARGGPSYLDVVDPSRPVAGLPGPDPRPAGRA